MNDHLGHLDDQVEPLDDCLSPLAYLLRLFDGDGGCSDSDVVVVLLW